MIGCTKCKYCSIYETRRIKAKRENEKWCSHPLVNDRIIFREFEMVDNCSYYKFYGDLTQNGMDSTSSKNPDREENTKSKSYSSVSKSLIQIRKEVYNSALKAETFKMKIKPSIAGSLRLRSCSDCFHFRYTYSRRSCKLVL